MVEVKHKSEAFQNLKKTMGQTPRVQKDLDDAHERYYQASRDVEEVEANMSLVRRTRNLEQSRYSETGEQYKFTNFE